MNSLWVFRWKHCQRLLCGRDDESGEWEKWSVEPDGGVGAEDEWRGTPTPQQQSHTQHDVPAPQAHLQHNTACTHSRMAPQYQQIYTTTVFGSTMSSQYDDTPHLFILKTKLD